MTIVRSSWAVALSYVLTLTGVDRSCNAETIGLRREAFGTAMFGDGPEESCVYDGTVLLSHPMSIDKDDRYYVLGYQMLQAAHMTIDQVNRWPRCGLNVDDRRRKTLLGYSSNLW